MGFICPNCGAWNDGTNITGCGCCGYGARIVTIASGTNAEEVNTDYAGS